MAELDIDFAVDQFKKHAGREPDDHELDRIKQAVITVPITESYEDYVKFWEREVADILNRSDKEDA